MNCLSSTTIWSKTPLDIWSGGVAQDYDLLWVFESPAYFSVKYGKVKSRVKKFVFFGVKKNMKDYKLWDPENKKIVLSKCLTFDKTSLLKSTISQRMERMKTKNVYRSGWSFHYLQLVWYQLGSHRMWHWVEIM